MTRLVVVALVAGALSPLDLWTLRALAGLPVELKVVKARTSRSSPGVRHLRNLVRTFGLKQTCSRVLGNIVVGSWYQRIRARRLAQLFGRDELVRWWEGAGVECLEVEHLNARETQHVLATLRPDVIVRVSGGILKRATFSQARIATLNIHHGMAPRIRGMWSIPWGIIEGRSDWIGATIHVIDEGIDTGGVLWRGAPQLAPGDTGEELLFRAHLEAVSALADLLRAAAGGNALTPLQEDVAADSEYRSAPGLGAWLRYLYLGAGKRAPVLLARSVRDGFASGPQSRPGR